MACVGVVREFAYSDVLMLWDVLFTRHLARHFHLYLVVAVLQRHGGRIMADKVGWGWIGAKECWGWFGVKVADNSFWFWFWFWFWLC